MGRGRGQFDRGLRREWRGRQTGEMGTAMRVGEWVPYPCGIRLLWECTHVSFICTQQTGGDENVLV
jgi:hypothetical protein